MKKAESVLQSEEMQSCWQERKWLNVQRKAQTRINLICTRIHAYMVFVLVELALHLLGVVDRANPPIHTQRCVLTQNSIACPPWVYLRAFRHKICSNNHSASEHSYIVCDGSKQQREWGWMRIED